MDKTSTTPPDATPPPPRPGHPGRWKWVTVLVLLLLAGLGGEIWFKVQRHELYQAWAKTHQVEPLVVLVNRCVARENWRLVPKTPVEAEKACVTHLLAIQDAMGRADVTTRLREIGYWTPDLGSARPQALSPVPAWEDGLPDELSARNPSPHADGTQDMGNPPAVPVSPDSPSKTDLIPDAPKPPVATDAPVLNPASPSTR